MTPISQTVERDTMNAERTRRSDRIRNISPEGTPAHPEALSRSINLVLAMIVVGMLTLALIVAVTLSPVAGVLLGAVALLALLLNPVFWASVLRASERGEVDAEN